MKELHHPAIENVALEHMFQALSDPVRTEIVNRLATMTEATCTMLNAGRPKSSMSHHYRVLRDSGLIRTRIKGTMHINTLRRAELDLRFPGLLDAVLGAIGVNAGKEAEDEAKGGGA
ncbi:ArsR/SmtB family transcription factor [Falsirhodobacter deserti]|uniref:ArsR/SmtB family transcription factor n=1 Tax=Falsirhodobacter deserti TaxID=1365611 RepID=UPI000FE43CBF|nr:helix-turn-helix transcriptional regulator [Falsirhodobacter deserti]